MRHAIIGHVRAYSYKWIVISSSFSSPSLEILGRALADEAACFWCFHNCRASLARAARQLARMLRAAGGQAGAQLGRSGHYYALPWRQKRKIGSFDAGLPSR
eukprot:368616-Pleurochrysis_carterae.AAC.1